MKINIKLLGDKVLIKPIEVERKTKSGLVIPDVALDKSSKGDVIAVSKHIDESDLLAGDQCFFEKHIGSRFTIEGENYLVIRITDIQLIVPQDK